jgi:Mrp family chromosome partitioning ATPase
MDLQRSPNILGTHWFHRRFTLTPQGRYVAVTELAEWARGPYDQLRKNLALETTVDRAAPRVIMLAPVRHGDGTTTTSILLAASLAQNHRVLVLDLNFRWPGVADAFGLAGAANLATLLHDPGLADPERVVSPTRIANLFVLPNSVNGSQRALPPVDSIQALLSRLRERYDYIVIDTAPVLRYPDTTLLAPLADVVLLLVAADATPVEECTAARRELERATVHIGGAVVTRQRQFVPEPLQRRFGGSSER